MQASRMDDRRPNRGPKPALTAASSAKQPKARDVIRRWKAARPELAWMAGEMAAGLSRLMSVGVLPADPAGLAEALAGWLDAVAGDPPDGGWSEPDDRLRMREGFVRLSRSSQWPKPAALLAAMPEREPDPEEQERLNSMRAEAIRLRIEREHLAEVERRRHAAAGDRDGAPVPADQAAAQARLKRSRIIEKLRTCREVIS